MTPTTLTTDPGVLADVAEDLARCAPTHWTPTARVQRAVALGIARVLLGDDPYADVLTAPAPAGLDGLLWRLCDLDDDGGSLPADVFDEGFAGVAIDGAPVRASLTVAALERVDPSWYRWRHADGYLVLVVGNPGGMLRFVQPLPGYHDATNRGFPTLPVTAPAVATLDELVPLVAEHMARLDRMIRWTLADRGDDGMHRCAPSYANDHVDLVDDVFANPGDPAAGVPPSINGLALTGYVHEFGNDTGAAFANPDTGGRLRLYREPSAHGDGCWLVDAMNRAAFDALDAADALERARPFEVLSVTSTRGPVLRLGDVPAAVLQA